MYFLRDLLFVYDGMDAFEFVVFLVEYFPYIMAVNIVMRDAPDT